MGVSFDKTLRSPSLVLLKRGKDLNQGFHDPLVSLNFEGFDLQILLKHPENLLLTFFDLYEGGHCDPLNRKLGDYPA